MAREWLLLETLGDEPTVIASGNQPRSMVPLGTFLRRNRHLARIRYVVAAVIATNRAAKVALPESDVVIDIRPISMPGGPVHGVWLWAGPTPPPSDPPTDSGAVLLNADTGALTLSDGAARAMGVSPNDPHTASVAELYRYIAPNPGETDVLGLIVTATEGMAYCGTWPGLDHEGRPTLCHFASRLVVERNKNGVPERLGRAINIRVGSPAESLPLLEQRVLEATAEPGSYRALVTIETKVLLKWIDTPPSELRWEHNSPGRPAVHPDDEAGLNFMIGNTKYGNTSAAVRFRHGGGWVVVDCTAQLVKLNPDAAVALVTHTRRAVPANHEVPAAQSTDKLGAP